MQLQQIYYWINKLFLSTKQGLIYILIKKEYSLKNTKCFINVPNSKANNVSELCAITNIGVLDFKIKWVRLKLGYYRFYQYEIAYVTTECLQVYYYGQHIHTQDWNGEKRIMI
ncbi:hypothetical protein DMUE_4766 [Dictyocoela muelleri]|nr:hypothetical protein DMUE_4766 [Dictyocoela muelleri]